MFERERLLDDTREGIPLVTKAKRQIRNTVAPRPSPRQVASWQATHSKHPTWMLRKPPRGEYNCAGHVWGSRRTAIYDESGEFSQIFSEDRYEKKDISEVIPGDLAVYYLNSGSKRQFLHVGEVIEEPSREQNLNQPLILSKFGDTGGEYIHRLSDMPIQDYSVEFWSEK